jgi:hypothetical protein
MLVSGNDVYAAGFYENSSGMQIPGYWLNGNWVSLAPPPGSPGGAITDITNYGNDVYAGGYSFDNSGEFPIPGYWLNGTWVGLPLPSGSTYGMVNSLCVK